MNQIFELLGLTIISFLIVLLMAPSNVAQDVKILSPKVLDTEGNPIEKGASYVFLPANTIEKLSPKVKGIGLTSTVNACPFHVALSSTAVSLKFSVSPLITDIREGDRLNFRFNYKGKNCPEVMTWQVDLPFGSRFPGYVVTGNTMILSNPTFKIKRADDNKSGVYKVQYCNILDRCVDVIVKETSDPDVMALVVNENGVPLHVKFQKS
ncbi:trypsin inhibitor B-like [Silene latifolia]|uniref:trypsin inhibitor B-like n=1 Tax=Silene latifolia TaxID=37657 RepID=UPI003D77E332